MRLQQKRGLGATRARSQGVSDVSVRRGDSPGVRNRG